MEWQTEKLAGHLIITKDDAPVPIHRQRFYIPASEATGPDAKRNILRCAGCDYPDIRCVKHSRTYYISSRIELHEQFCFRCPDFPGIEYCITLEDDYSASRITFWPVDGCLEHSKEFSDFLKQMTENQYDDLTLSFCMPHELLPAINQTARIHYLTLFECVGAKERPLSREISRMEDLRGLCLRGSGAGVLDSAAVEEFSKLKNLESLMVGFGFPVSVDALPKIGILKNLKALRLDFFGNCGIEPVRRSTLVSTLSSLRELENLEILILDTRPRLSPHELALPPNLKYLQLNDRVCHLPVSPAKPRQTKNKPAPKKTKSDDGEQSLF